MLEFIGGLCGLTTVGLYGYVAVHALYAELKTGASIPKALGKAATWPLTLVSTIRKLYDF